MLTVFDIKTKTMLNAPDFFELLEGFRKFRGVSFVSSFEVIEKLNQQFDTVQLILGLEEAKTGSLLNQVFDIGRRVRELESSSEELLNAFENGSVHLKFNRDVLFHSKYFILENETHFLIFSGSMNLTKAAMRSNHENAMMYAGEFSSPEDTLVYQNYDELFTTDFELNAVDYIDRKTVKVFRESRTADERLAIVSARIVEHDQVAITAENLKEISVILNDDQAKLNHADAVAIKYELGQPEILQTLKATYQTSGKPKSPAKAKAELKKIHLRVRSNSPAQEQSAELEKANPQWLYAPDEHELLIRQEDDSLQVLEDQQVHELDVSTFVDIIQSYNHNKMRDESHQAMSAFLFAMTAPLLWRIRSMVMETGNNPDQIPIVLAILGSGSSGKTTMVDDYLKPFIGDKSPLLSEEHIKTVYGSTNAGNKGPVGFMNSYMESREISPLIVDEMSTDFLTKPAVQPKIKHWANARSNFIRGPQGTIIITSNADGAVLEEAIKKRVWYLSITSDYKSKDEQVYNFATMASQLNDNMYRHTVFELNRRLNELTSNEVIKFTENFLWLTAEIVQELLAVHGFEGTFPARFFEPYRYDTEIAKKTIRDTIQQAQAKNSLTFDANHNDRAVVLRSTWESTGTFAGKQVNEMNEFKALLPANCVFETSQKAITISISETDRYLGEELLAELKMRSSLNTVPRDKYFEAIVREKDLEQENLKLKFELEKQELLKAKGRSRRWFKLK